MLKITGKTALAAAAGFILYVVADWAIRHYLDTKFPTKGM